MPYKATKNIPAYPGISGLFGNLDKGETEMNLEKCIKIHLDKTIAGNGVATDIYDALPITAVVTRVLLNVTTAEATAAVKTINVGTNASTGGDADGFIKAGNVGTKTVLVGAGDLIGKLVSGNDKINITLVDADFVEFVGDLYIFYIEV